MNNNRGNNRRRGRGNNNGNNRQQGGQQTNRIDSRARGNAPQLLEKYRKLAHDAMLNGDRVTEEYYLQFADHYFRVIADQKQRQEEMRQPRRDERVQNDEVEDAADDYYPHPVTSVSRHEPRNDAPRNEQRHEPRYEQRQDRTERQDRQPRDSQPENAEAAEGADGSRSIYEPAENPFVRDNRQPRGAQTRTGKPQRAPRRAERGDDETSASAQEEAAPSFDPATLPPSIATSDAEEGAKPKPKTRRPRTPKADAAGEAPAAPVAEADVEEKPRRRRTRKATPTDEAGNPLETVD
ncbi:DUF4167 domain-containing protein [Novosphingobium sp. 9]|uniref:DUF4167 domain-containing protein n=1 Tax=Novosphingobium sp. 9 TaxID=2025349 RepID=UPI0021B60E7A|nr:DUF4167 domain-containing protein [Novosphingobium sp. 9]